MNWRERDGGDEADPGVLSPARPFERAARGRAAERIAERFLRAHGWQILARNVRISDGELDIVARDGREIVFVEVRARRQGSRFAPQATIGRIKRRRLIATAAAWLAQQRRAASPCRFDVIAVTVSRAGFRVRHLRGAFVDDTHGDR